MLADKVTALDARIDTRAYANRMRSAADALLSTLSAEQLAKALFPFEDEEERRDWDFIPKYRRNGLALRDMTARQQVLAQQLLASALSLPGYTKALSIMSFENVLRELNAPRAGLAAAEFRHPGKYQFSFFGEPHAEQTWAWRMVGHHVAVNFTIVDGTYVAPTPLLFGSEPAQFGVFRPLIDDEDRGFLLLDTLDTAQRQQAIIHDVAPPDFVTRVVKKLGDEELPGDHELGFDHYVISDHDREMLKWIRHQARGLPGASMNTRQLSLFRDILAGYVERLPEEPARLHLERLERAGFEQFTFAWAGHPERGKPHYYRVQGPSFLVEFENAQVGGGLPGEANHIHTVWRDPAADFGMDVLAAHRLAAH
jgi:hypothetical protein